MQRGGRIPQALHPEFISFIYCHNTCIRPFIGIVYTLYCLSVHMTVAARLSVTWQWFLPVPSVTVALVERFSVEFLSQVNIVIFGCMNKTGSIESQNEPVCGEEKSHII